MQTHHQAELQAGALTPLSQPLFSPSALWLQGILCKTQFCKSLTFAPTYQQLVKVRTEPLPLVFPPLSGNPGGGGWGGVGAVVFIR